MKGASGKLFHPLDPLWLVVGGRLVQIELVVQNDEKSVGGVEIHDEHEAIQDRVLWQVAATNSRHVRGGRGLRRGGGRGVCTRLDCASYHHSLTILR
jgi:hypothetical protein